VKTSQLRNRILLSVGLGLLVVAGLFLYGDVSKVGDSLRYFHWEYLPLILALTLFNYVLRFVKWTYYLKLSEIKGVPFTDSLLIFLSGLGMSITPAKVGEWIKSYFLKVRHDVDPGKSAPIVIAERVSDGVAMLLLAGIGLLFVDQGWVLLLILAVLLLLTVAAFRNKTLANALVSFANRLPLLKRHTGFLTTFFTSSQILFSPGPVAFAAGIGLVSWFGEAVALYYVFLGLGAEPGLELLTESIFILSISTMVGAVLLLPGGLGAAETSIAGLGQELVGLAREAAATGALLIRICTLWFGVGLGFIAIAMLARRKDWWAQDPEGEEAL